jgi:release factor glutamine methyltransferase
VNSANPCLLTQLIRIGVEEISSVYPEREAREMVYAYLEHRIGTKRHTHIVDPSFVVAEIDAQDVIAAFHRMATGEPLQYVTGKADFYGRQFNVTSEVLIPRPETEILCREVLTEKAGKKALDLCTGSGCIAWTLALEHPGLQVTAVDISDGALKVASSQDFSEEILRTAAQKPTFIKADVLTADPTEFPKFDILVSNPPYVMDKEKALMRSNVLDHEPSMALFVSDDDPLVFYRAVARTASRLLAEDGFGIVEINEALGDETAALFTAVGFPTAKVIHDLSGRDRFVLFKRS